MHRISFIKQIILGVVLGGLLLPASAQAQFGGIVHDPKQTAMHIANWSETLAKWEQAIRQYEQMILHLSNLPGILGTVEQTLAFDKKMRTTISDIGQLIRMSYRLKNQIQNIVISQAHALSAIETRLRNGIFDPEQDRRDFEEYLRSSIGRYSQETIAELERLEKMDNQLERLNHEKAMAEAEAAGLEQQVKAKTDEIAALQNCDSCTDKDVQMAKLSLDLTNLQHQTEDAHKETRRLQGLATERVQEIEQRHMQEVSFGRQIKTLNDGWKQLTQAKQWLREKMRHDSDNQ